MHKRRPERQRIAGGLPNAALQLDRASAVAMHTQLYLQLREAILSGRLAAGARLPSTRDLAAELSISRNTALEAFTRLASEGYVEGLVGNGSYVSRQLPEELLHIRKARIRARREESPAPIFRTRRFFRSARRSIAAGRDHFARARRRWMRFRTASGNNS